MLVACMVDLYNVGTYNANTGFKADYLNELERMLEKVLPHAMLKAKPNLSHKVVGQFRHHNFPYYDQLTSIYAKDRATGKDSQTTIDIVEEIDADDATTANNLEEGNNYRGCEDDVSLDEMDVSAIQPQLPKPSQDDFISSKKKKKISDESEQISTSITDVVMLLGENIQTIGLELSRSIAFEKVIQESAQKSYPTLC
ncbi:hypothetical protein Gotri_024933, partial [Gossypium trilobum]|nr:hypothetical protein [Gossypium trilobum]